MNLDLVYCHHRVWRRRRSCSRRRGLGWAAWKAPSLETGPPESQRTPREKKTRRMRWRRRRMRVTGRGCLRSGETSGCPSSSRRRCASATASSPRWPRGRFSLASEVSVWGVMSSAWWKAAVSYHLSVLSPPIQAAGGERQGPSHGGFEGAAGAQEIIRTMWPGYDCPPLNPHTYSQPHPIILTLVKTVTVISILFLILLWKEKYLIQSTVTQDHIMTWITGSLSTTWD